jgi:hypothetical protein
MSAPHLSYLINTIFLKYVNSFSLIALIWLTLSYQFPRIICERECEF